METQLIRNEPGPIQRFIFEGKPGTKQAMRVSPIFDGQGKAVTKLTSGGKTSVMLRKFQDEKTINNANFIRWCIRGQLPYGWQLWDGAIIVRQLDYIFYPPKNLTKRVAAGEFIYVQTKPDLTDNLNKLLFDAMNQLVYVDDSQIVHLLECRKFYGLQPKTVIVMELI